MSLLVASISGGKDSAALFLWLKELGLEHRRVFADTGWEHPETLDYIAGPLTAALGPIETVRADKTMVPLIRHKGMFPSRTKRWCSDELKLKPLACWVAAQSDEVVMAVGIRAEESEKRAAMPEREWSDGLDCEVWRPLLAWTLDNVIAIHRKHGLAPNPLYARGANRVGCWPCVMVSKGEMRMIAESDPARIAEIRDLEAELTGRAGKPRAMFAARTGRKGLWPIDKVAEWSRTTDGGRQIDLLPAVNTGCMRWGLCEGPVKP